MFTSCQPESAHKHACAKLGMLVRAWDNGLVVNENRKFCLQSTATRKLYLSDLSTCGLFLSPAGLLKQEGIVRA